MRLARICAGCIFLLSLISAICSGADLVGKTIAVSDFRVNSPDGRLNYLAEGLAGSLAAQLANVQGIVVVERSRINEAFSELKLGITGILDASTASQLGRHVGAQLVILGELVDFNGLLQLSARVVDVETGNLHTGFTEECNNERDLPRAIERLAGRLAALLTGNASTDAKEPEPPTQQLTLNVSDAMKSYQALERHSALGFDLSTVSYIYKDKLLGYPRISLGVNPYLGVSYRLYLNQPKAQLVEAAIKGAVAETPSLSLDAMRAVVKSKIDSKVFMYGGAHTAYVLMPYLLDVGVTYDLSNADGVGFNLNASLLLSLWYGNLIPWLGFQYTF